MSVAPATIPPPVDPAPARVVVRGWVAAALALLPALLIVLGTPAFSTQDGPAHLYNARILADAVRLGDRSPYASVYEVRAQPVPNWAGHLATVAALEVLPAGLVTRAVTAATLVALALGSVLARWRVAGPDGLTGAGLVAALLGLNVAWLFGFTSFLLGAALVPVTLGSWWRARDRPGPGLAARLAGLLVAGYFCHPISLAAAVLGLAVLALATPADARLRRNRLGWAAVALVPLVPLGAMYLGMTRSGGGFAPVWEHLGGRWASPRAWLAQLSWVEPISLAAKTSRPFGDVGAASGWYALLAPAAWAGAGLVLLAGSTLRNARPEGRERRGWLILAVLLLGAGVLGPDTLGISHGYYLPQRLTLLGLVVLVPWLDLAGRTPAARAGLGLVAAALVLQVGAVAEYAADCSVRVAAFLRAGPSLPAGTRVGAIAAGTRGRFLSNPLLHADCLLGLDPPRVVWGNYETDHYYFPVQVRPGIPHPRAIAFERVSFLDDPTRADERARLWEELLAEHRDRIDAVVAWQAPPALDAITARWYSPIAELGPVRTWARRDPAPDQP